MSPRWASAYRRNASQACTICGELLKRSCALTDVIRRRLPASSHYKHITSAELVQKLMQFGPVPPPSEVFSRKIPWPNNVVHFVATLPSSAVLDPWTLLRYRKVGEMNDFEGR